jgi:hypothetical protein
VDEKWNPGDANDPIGHAPEIERDWLARYRHTYPEQLKVDEALHALLV